VAAVEAIGDRLLVNERALGRVADPGTLDVAPTTRVLAALAPLGRWPGR